MTAQAKLGFIGLGAMGLPMAQRILGAGHALAVWGRTGKKLKPALDQGATACASAADLARDCDIVFTCLTDTDAVEAVVFGEDGLAQGGAANKILVDSSTIHPGRTREMAQRLKAETGMAWVDMPVSGGAAAAREGRLTLMAGGDAADIARMRPHVEAFCGRFTHLGPIGTGQAAKACNQLIVGGTIALVAEALRLAKHAGIDTEMLPDALSGGWADSTILQLHGRRMAAGEHRSVVRPPQAGGPVPPLLMLKDMQIADDMGRELGARMPITTLVTQMYRLAQDQGLGEAGQYAVARLLDDDPDQD